MPPSGAGGAGASIVIDAGCWTTPDPRAKHHVSGHLEKIGGSEDRVPRRPRPLQRSSVSTELARLEGKGQTHIRGGEARRGEDRRGEERRGEERRGEKRSDEDLQKPA